jgi:hypothetical protein
VDSFLLGLHVIAGELGGRLGVETTVDVLESRERDAKKISIRTC